VTLTVGSEYFAPDFVEPVLGWRVWYAVADGNEIRLSSIIHRTVWPTRAPLVATCRRFRLPLLPSRSHEAPAAECRCGIYATTAPALHQYLSEESAWDNVFRVALVVGRTSLWGVVHESERGWRASFAYPKELFVPVAALRAPRAQRVITALADYCVPVRAVGGATVDAVLDEVAALAA
jgi:hypothetical protein